MSISLEFHVLLHAGKLTDLDGASAVCRLRHPGDLTEFVGQFADLSVWDIRNAPTPVVKSHEVPRGFKLDIGGEEEYSLVSCSPLYDGKQPLRYSYSDELCKAQLTEHTSHFDAAIMAFFEKLDTNIPVVLYLS